MYWSSHNLQQLKTRVCLRRDYPSPTQQLLLPDKFWNRINQLGQGRETLDSINEILDSTTNNNGFFQGYYLGMESQYFQVGVKLLIPSQVSGPSNILIVKVLDSAHDLSTFTASACDKFKRLWPLIMSSTSPFCKINRFLI